MADGQRAPRLLSGSHELVGLGQAARDGLLHEHVAPCRERVEDDASVLVGRDRDGHSVGPLALDQLFVRPVAAGPGRVGDPPGGLEVGVGDADELNAWDLAQHANVVAAHGAGADDGDPAHSRLTAETIRSRSPCSSSGCTGVPVSGLKCQATTSRTWGKRCPPIG